MHSDASAIPIAFEYVPAKHGSGADDPRGQKLPPVHVSQPVAPESPWKLPAAHCPHQDARVPDANVPGEQRKGAVAPVCPHEGSNAALVSGVKHRAKQGCSPRFETLRGYCTTRASWAVCALIGTTQATGAGVGPSHARHH